MVSFAIYWGLVRSNRNYRRLWLAQIVSEMGDWIYSITLYSLLLELTGRAQSVTLALAMQLLPQFFVSPAAGVLNDRLSRKRVMIAADIVRAGIVTAMLFAARAQAVTLIYALFLLESVSWAFFEPGRTAVVPNITDDRERVAANTLSSITWSCNLAIGAGIGGAVGALLGRDAVFVLNALSFIASALLLRGMRFPEPHLAGAKPMRVRDLTDFSPVLEGMRYVARNRRILALLLAKAGLGLVGTHWALLPLLGNRVFAVKAAGGAGKMLGMSALMSLGGLGSLAGPLFASRWAGDDRGRLRRGVLIGFAMTGLGYLGLSVAPSLALAALGAALAQAGGSTVWVFTTTLLQFETDDRFRGRVFSADFAFLVLTMALANSSVGAFADWGVPVRTLAAASALMALVPAVYWIFASRYCASKT